MTIAQVDKVDGMGIDGVSGEVVLIISDHLAWNDEESHLLLLEEKLSNYINFINSQQISEALPKAKGLPARIKLLHAHNPSPSAESILNSVQGQLAGMGILFSHESLPEPY